MDDFDFDDDEGSDHQDYDANYFDNGEGDDDSGGEEGEFRGSFLDCIQVLRFLGGLGYMLTRAEEGNNGGGGDD